MGVRPLRSDEVLVGKLRRLRRLLVDVLWYLEHPGKPEFELERRGRLIARIREVTDE